MKKIFLCLFLSLITLGIHSQSVVEMTFPILFKNSKILKPSEGCHFLVSFDMSDSVLFKVAIYEVQNKTTSKKLIKNFDFKINNLQQVPPYFEDRLNDHSNAIGAWVDANNEWTIFLDESIIKGDDLKSISHFLIEEETINKKKSIQKSPYLESKDSYISKINIISDFLFKNSKEGF